jgi:hypothetical protein
VAQTRRSWRDFVALRTDQRESFIELRRNAGLSLPAIRRVLGEMADGLFDLASG